MRRHTKFSDIVTMNDDLKRRLAAGSNIIKPGFDTRIIITANNCEYDGSHSVEVNHNKTVLPGRTQLLESVFPITPNIADQHIFLNDNVLGEYDANSGENIPNCQTCANTPTAALPRNNMNLFRRRKVAWMMAGDGALNKTVLSQSYESHSTNTKLYHCIPFRFVKNDYPLEDEFRRLYKFKVVYNSSSPYYGYTGYYMKKIEFESQSGINMVVDKMPYKPSWADTATDLNADTIGYQNKFKGDKVQSNYIDMSMHIAANEFKEWFQFTDGTKANASISEIGLITGLDCIAGSNSITPLDELDPNTPNYATQAMNSEVYDAELFAHLTFDPYSVSRENSTLDFDYRIYS
ncbi:MAG: hypothetical protein K2N99_02690 [Malacoplasma sp.]|nr:hypothetical protein [Malacoplasma sp.]